MGINREAGEPRKPVSDTDSSTSESDSLASLSSSDISSKILKINSDAVEHTLLGHVELNNRSARDHEILTAPIFTRDAYIAGGGAASFPQRGVLGSVMDIGGGSSAESSKPHDARLYVNTVRQNTPFSAVVCGVQGSGKSHTVSILLENMLIPKYKPTGELVKPLSALVLHFGEGGSLAQPSEAAWVTVANASALKVPNIKVYVSKSALKTMTAVYAKLGPHVKVEPLLFSHFALDAQAFLSMMAVGQNGNPPLYMSSVMSILHALGEDYTYAKFKAKVDKHKENLNAQQLNSLDQRMLLLETFLENKITASRSRFAAGQLTVVDLSDPFLDPSQACGLFEIVTRLFVRAKVDTGRLLVLDEAHKYLDSGTGFTRQLTALIRLQRHLAMRVIIKPNVVPPILLDLCTISILHRFSSPSWWEHVAKHVSTDIPSAEAFDRIVKLQTGQAIVLAPSGLGTFEDRSQTKSEKKVLGQFGRRWLLVKTRQRVTRDGGASVLVVNN
ncbi:hypothetical protein BXZ70DRAFT_904130 [Cristinia sonorae]|uniref:Zona occludens toxin N-terminal domain-containing protein n=1 Tax=Cristinia sonorae TaxID=1940300 RepID=A0A8K0XTM8_9AGAR|nr:hypothetical protein BXZ70DRAFT_904130 [Cristinia sonorae]